jgi:hypothetical protein
VNPVVDLLGMLLPSLDEFMLISLFVRSPRRGRSRSRSMSPRSSRSRSPRDDRRRNRSRTPLNGSNRYNDEAGAPPSNSTRDTQQDRRVYVGNLSYEVKWPQLKDYMRTGIIVLSMAVDCV